MIYPHMNLESSSNPVFPVRTHQESTVKCHAGNYKNYLVYST
ncbi:MAG: hypothetical protein A4E66_02275 [Syntrophus sp. PtaB.Bin001]|nr:MAG: hypothetical protein A4E66_02275 [Syntrophus sp. PtaB.Bin001]